MFSVYIPTSLFLSSNNLEQYTDSTPAMLTIRTFNLVGSPFPIKGVDTFTLQHNPSMLANPAIKAFYSSKNGLGMTRESNHFLNTARGEESFSCIITDTYEGTPHSTLGPTGEVVRNDFENLFECASWFENLAVPITEWQKPPYVRVSLGRYSAFGFVKEVKVTWLKMQGNGEALIAKVDFTLKSDSVNSSSEKAFYEVK